jgi:putative Holliday junction resolvase
VILSERADGFATVCRLAENRRVIALDYGAARTGVAVSDPTGTLARPLETIASAGSEAGLRRVAELVAEHDAGLVVVGLPLTLRGERGEQAQETERFVESLRLAVTVPVETFDERFTTTLAAQTGSAGGRAGEDARAAAHLLAGYLERIGSGQE